MKLSLSDKRIREMTADECLLVVLAFLKLALRKMRAK